MSVTSSIEYLLSIYSRTKRIAHKQLQKHPDPEPSRQFCSTFRRSRICLKHFTSSKSPATLATLNVLVTPSTCFMHCRATTNSCRDIAARSADASDATSVLRPLAYLQLRQRSNRYSYLSNRIVYDLLQ